MPTGYTQDVPNGISFATFAMNCARAFGACIMLRDEEPGGDKIPETFEPSDYHAKAIEEAKSELARLVEMTEAECLLASIAEWDKGELYRVAQLEECAKTRASYQAMLAQVHAWIAPTGDHVKFKAFMIDQLVQSIDFDCDEKYHAVPAPKLDGAQWRNARRQKLERDVDYHTRQHADEVERAAGRTAWVQALRGSL